VPLEVADRCFGGAGGGVHPATNRPRPAAGEPPPAMTAHGQAQAGRARHFRYAASSAAGSANVIFRDHDPARLDLIKPALNASDEVFDSRPIKATGHFAQHLRVGFS